MTENVFEKPRADFVRVDETGFDHEFKPITEKVSEHLGELFIQNVFEEGTTLSHSQLCNWIGATAVRLIPDTSMRQWSTSIDDRQELEDLLWSKAVWTLVHVLPVGFMVSNRQFHAQGYRWNPALAPLRRATKASNSNRIFSGFPISQAVYLKLFPETLESPFSMLTFAIIDTFSSKPNTDNPFYNAIRDAIRMTLISHPYRIPYFWLDFIHAFFAHNPHDLQKFQASMSMLKPTNSIDIDHDTKKVEPSPSPSSPEPVPVPVPESESESEPHKMTELPPKEVVKPAFSSTPPETKSAQLDYENDDPSANTAPSEEAFHRESLRKLYASWGKSDDKSQQLLLRDIVLYWAKIVSEKVQSGKFSINAPGAFAYINDGVFITEGGLKRMLSLVNDPDVNWHDWMIHNGLLSSSSGILHTQAKDIPIKTWLLKKRVESFFVPDLDSYDASDVFSSSEETVS